MQNRSIRRSRPLQIRVCYPKTREEEHDAAVLLREDVGLYFALGGSAVLKGAREALRELQERRQGKSETITDPIVTNIVRCRGIDRGRAYLRFRDGKFRPDEGDRKEAAGLLESLKADALKTFDRHTAEATKELAKKHRRAVTRKSKK